MKKVSVILSILMFLFNFLYGQLQINWQQSYGSMASDWGSDIAETDSGYLVTGIAGTGGGEVDCFEGNGGGWLIKIDDSGDLIWQKCFDYAQAFRIVKAIGSPYYYLIGGATLKPYPDDYNLWIAKIDKLGNIIWERALGNTIGVLSGDQNGEATADGGVIATAQIDSQGGDITNWWGGYDGWIIKLDSAGNTEWDQSIGSSQFEFINGIIQTSDSGYLAGLYGTPNGIGGNIDCDIQSTSNPDAIIAKLNADGLMEWHQCYGGSGHEGVTRLRELNDGYLICGFGSSTDGDLVGSGWHPGWDNTGQPTLDVWLVKVDFLGNIIWQKCYGGSNEESPVRIFQTSDSDFIVFANTNSFDGDVVGNPSNSPENPSIWIFKVDSTGNFLWQQCIGGHADEQELGVVKQSDYNYAMAGEMNFSPSGDVNCSNFVYGSSQNYWVLGIKDITVSNHENYIPESISIYPNPASMAINIDLAQKYSNYNTMIEIIDISGKTVMKLDYEQTNEPVRIDDLKSGLYLIKITGNNNCVTKKIIKL